MYAPPGRYLFRGTLDVPEGSRFEVPISACRRTRGYETKAKRRPGEDGTALFVVSGRGKEDGKPFLTLNSNSSVNGLTIFYPEQDTESIPEAYPWTIAMRGKNPAVQDVELLNPYLGIDASQNERHNIRNVTGQPLRRGIWVDAIYDIGRIENVHFNPWWSSHGKAYRLADGKWGSICLWPRRLGVRAQYILFWLPYWLQIRGDLNRRMQRQLCWHRCG